MDIKTTLRSQDRPHFVLDAFAFGNIVEGYFANVTDDILCQIPQRNFLFLRRPCRGVHWPPDVSCETFSRSARREELCVWVSLL